MIIKNENAFYANLSLYSDDPHWGLSFPDDTENHQVPIGTIVFTILNRINRIKGDGHIDFSRYEPQIINEMRNVVYDKEVWNNCYDEIMHIIENRTDMNKTDKYRAYKIYSQLAYFLIWNLDWDEWMYFAESCEKADDIINTYYKYHEEIIFRGNVSRKDTLYAVYEVAGFEYLFMLDLLELLFNLNVKLNVKQCQYCRDFFYSKNNQQKYCSECKKRERYNRIKNEKQKEDEAKVLAKRTGDLLYRREKEPNDKDGGIYPSQEYQNFLDENQYYKDKLKGKPVEPKPHYLDITTKEEYVQWLKDYHTKLIEEGKKKIASQTKN